MDILNWLNIKRQRLIKETVNNPDTDLLVLGAQVPFTTRDDGYQTYAMTVNDFTSSARGYKNYIAVLTQNGIDPPEAVVLENTLGVNVTFDYDGVGLYYLIFDQSLFTSPQSYVTLSQNSQINGANDLCVIQSTPVFFNVLELTSYEAATPADDIVGALLPNIIEVRVYN